MQAGNIDFILISSIGNSIFVVILWCLLSFFISSMTGWFTLAKRFKANSEPYGDCKNTGPFFYTIYMRLWSHYGSVIQPTAAPDAVYSSVLFPFRIGHPPLCITWNQIQFSRTKRFWRPYLVLTLGVEAKIPMRISPRMARNLGIFDRFPVS
jgi:hypothetical protein